MNAIKKATWLSSVIVGFFLNVGFLPTAHAVSYEPLTGVTKVVAGYGSSCALTGSGGVKCWGRNVEGQLGNGTLIGSTAPTDVSGLSGVTAIALKTFHVCVLTNAGGVKCWGDNTHGQLGDGTTTNRSTPVDVSGLSSGVIAIATGSQHSCALTAAGAVKCWGRNLKGAFGNGTSNNTSPVPVASNVTSGAVAVTAGGLHTCALMNTSHVLCWGSNSNGQLGAAVPDSELPSIVGNDFTGVTAISSGDTHTCAKMSNSTAKCWGFNFTGAVGNGAAPPYNVYSPMAVLTLTSVSSLAETNSQTCAVNSGAAYCWGENYFGQLGNGTTTNAYSPSAVQGLNSGVLMIAGGSIHGCAVITDGRVKCWGVNRDGQLGNPTQAGTTTPLLTPVDVVVPAIKTLTVSNATVGGSVTSNPAGINCGTTCTASFSTNSSVTLTANPPTSNYITVWSGACSSGTNTCTLTMDSAKSVSVKFVLGYPASVSAPTNGKITGLYINCGLGQTVCSANYRSLSTVKFTATPKTGYTFSGWTGDCASSSTNTCTLTVGQAQNLSATFAASVTYGLSVTKTGSGIVSGLSLNCGTTCSGNYKNGTVVTLTAKPALGSAFTGWSGACSGTSSTCSVNINAAKNVTATFN